MSREGGDSRGANVPLPAVDNHSRAEYISRVNVKCQSVCPAPSNTAVIRRSESPIIFFRHCRQLMRA